MVHTSSEDYCWVLWKLYSVNLKLHCIFDFAPGHYRNLKMCTKVCVGYSLSLHVEKRGLFSSALFCWWSFHLHTNLLLPNRNMRTKNAVVKMCYTTY